MEKNIIINIENLKVSYGDGDRKVDVLRGLDCVINKGEICTLLGPSGSGKSTFLNIVGGLEKVKNGRVRVNNLELNGLSNKKIEKYRRNTLGFIFQSYNLVADLTVRENIEVGAYLNDSSMDLDEMLDLLGLKEHAYKFPNQISGGQQQRTAVGRALIKNPEVLLCDEPTGALDFEHAKEVLQLIQDINEKYKTTIILATHNTALSHMSHRTLVIHNGKIEDKGYNNNILRAGDLEW